MENDIRVLLGGLFLFGGAMVLFLLGSYFVGG